MRRVNKKISNFWPARSLLVGRLGHSWWVGSVTLGGSALRIFHGSTVQVERIEDSASAGLTCLDASMESSSPSDRDGFDVGVTRKH